jgi:hypothetical protein
MQPENRELAILLAVAAMLLLVSHKAFKAQSPSQHGGLGLGVPGTSGGKPGLDNGFVLKGGITYEEYI